MGHFDLKGLTIGERLLIYRRRKRFTQEVMAVICRTNRNLYGKIERDEEEIPYNLRPYVPVPKITELSKTEAALLKRRRAGLTQEDAAIKFGEGISRHWYGAKERGEAPNRDLLDYWDLHERKQRVSD